MRHPARPRSPGRARLWALFAAAALVSSILPTSLVATVAAAGPTLPSGFTDELLATGLNHPSALAFAADGRVFVAEQRGVVKTWATYASLVANQAPAIAIDIQTQVDNYWDRGLLGLAVDPDWPAQPYVYLLYTYDALPGGGASRWNDVCPNPPGPTTDGCVVTGRLDRVQMDTTTGLATGSTTHLITDWCQQFPSHSIGTIVFGADKMLYAGAGDGANFNAADWGQFGGTLPNTTTPVTPANPCGDPVDPAGIPPLHVPPVFDASAEGGAMRSQSVDTSRSPVWLDGSIIRIDPHSATGAAAAGNPLIGSSDLNKRRIVAYGMRNPFRFTVRPGTDDLWIGDVGYNTWEELDHLPNPTDPAGPPDFGWPCYENLDYGNYYNAGEPALCAALKASGTTTPPVWAYRHGSGNHMVTGDGCLTGGASISGLAFYTGAAYPTSYQGGLFVADYTRRCIVFMPAGGNGLPDPSSAIPFEANAPDSSTAGAGPVQLVAVPASVDPAGDILYVNLGASSGTAGEIHRIRYSAPQAAFSATPNSGAAPLDVHLDASGSTTQVAGGLTYTWDLDDGNGPSTGPPVFDHAFGPGSYHVHLTVTDSNGAISQVTHLVSSANTPPLLSIDQPAGTLTWQVGDSIHLSGTATDTQDGDLSSQIEWTVTIKHCPQPNSCHTHPLVTFTGASGDIVAPDHDTPTWLEVSASITDSGGLDDSGTVDIYPQTSDVTLGTSPSGLPVTLGTDSGTGPLTIPMVVGSTRTISTPSLATVGERTYAFTSWSDAGAISHQITATPGPRTVTAAFQLIDTDAPESCHAARPQSSLGGWFSGSTRNATDVDWYRFTVTSTRAVQVVLGDLASNSKLQLYRGCSTLLATSDGPGTSPEEIIRTLTPGTYSLRIVGHGGYDVTQHYQVRIRPLAGSMVVLSSSATVTTGTLRIAGEVLNATTSRRGPATVTAKLYDAGGHLLATWTKAAYLPVLDPLARSPFVLSGAAPAGYDHVVLTVATAAVSTATPVKPSFSGTSAGSVAGSWTVSGQVKNASGATMRSVRVLVTEYDGRGDVIAVAYVVPSVTTLAPGRSTSFTTAFGSIAPALTRLAGRASR